jgi:hypothetical protein
MRDETGAVIGAVVAGRVNPGLTAQTTRRAPLRHRLMVIRPRAQTNLSRAQARMRGADGTDAVIGAEEVRKRNPKLVSPLIMHLTVNPNLEIALRHLARASVKIRA